MSLFDQPVPFWRTVGTVNVPDGSMVLLGDPCYGALDPVDGVRLPGGTYRWDIRDADEAGKSVHREAAVRLVRDDAPVDTLDSWDYWDVYGSQNPLPFPQEHGQVAAREFRGVDSGTMTWMVRGSADDFEDMDLDDVLFDAERGVVTHDGLVLTTTSGWGDGGYPVVARSVDGAVVEVRIEFIPPETVPLTVGEFLRLLPGAMVDARDTQAVRAYYDSVDRDRAVNDWDAVKAAAPNADPVNLRGTVALRLTRTWYKSTVNPSWHEDYDPEDLKESRYDEVTEIIFPDAGHRFTSTYRSTLPPEGVEALFGELNVETGYDVLDRVVSLWSALPPEGKASLPVREQVLDVEQGEPVGMIREQTMSDVIVWLPGTYPFD